MATYLIETTTFSGMMKKDTKIYAKVSSLDPSDSLTVCPTVRGEILFGIEKMPKGQKRTDLETKAQILFSACESRDITEPVGDKYAQIKHEAKVAGKSLSDNDLWIAATAICHNAVLVAADKDYAGLSGVLLEDWTK
jgi:predicted nucleic acid-binding protein